MAGARPAALLAAPLLALLCLRAVAAQPCTRLGGATNLAPATNLTCASGWQYQLPAAGVCAGSCGPSSAALSSCTYTAPTAAWCNAGNLTGHCPAQCRAAAVVQAPTFLTAPQWAAQLTGQACVFDYDGTLSANEYCYAGQSNATVLNAASEASGYCVGYAYTCTAAAQAAGVCPESFPVGLEVAIFSAVPATYCSTVNTSAPPPVGGDDAAGGAPVLTAGEWALARPMVERMSRGHRLAWLRGPD